MSDASPFHKWVPVHCPSPAVILRQSKQEYDRRMRQKRNPKQKKSAK